MLANQNIPEGRNLRYTEETYTPSLSTFYSSSSSMLSFTVFYVLVCVAFAPSYFLVCMSGYFYS